jgi:hypothetical protein
MAKQIVKFTDFVCGRYATRKHHTFKKGVRYSVDDWLLKRIEEQAGKKLWVAVAEKSVLKKQPGKTTASKTVNQTKTVDKASIAKRATKK